MLTSDEIDFLNKIPPDKIIKILPYDPRVKVVFNKISTSINSIYPNLEVKHMGASALEISGQNDVDIFAFSDPVDFDKYTPGFTKLFGEPFHRHETFVEWKFKKWDLDVELELNNRPRKRLEYMKPIEVFNKHLKGCTSN